ncbi:MAG: hypothetical protein IT232_08570 [Flavobacteriales bacterium]|nr:hypothetical protein [Flavobacteriales bacterium]
MKFLFSKNITDGQLYFEVPEGNYKAFVIMFQGTNGAVAATLDDLGTLMLNYKKYPLINDVDFELLSFLNNLKGGFATFTSVALGALSAYIYIPCGEFGDDTNSYLVERNDVLYLRMNYSALAALAGISGTVRIFGVESDGVQNYLFSITQRNVVASGAGRVGDTDSVQNVSSILLKNFAAVTDVLITKDGKLKADATATELLAQSNFINQVEASVSLIEVGLNPARTLEENVGNEVSFSYNFTGVTTLEQYFCSIVLTPDKAARSVIINNQKVGNKIANGIIKSEPAILPAGNVKGGSSSGGGVSAVPVINPNLLGAVKVISPSELSL